MDNDDPRVHTLMALLDEARLRIAASGADAIDSWTVAWNDEGEAFTEIDRLKTSVAVGYVPLFDLGMLVAPTSPLQDLSMAAGWADEFLVLASRFDDAITACES